MTKQKNITEFITLLFVTLFIYTGISKVIEYSVFKEQIAMSPILHKIASLVAIMTPTAEFIIVVLLLVPRWRLKGLKASLYLMIIFTTYILSIFLFNKQLPCSCGGVIELLSWNQHIVFNSVFVLLALIGILFEKGIRLKNNQALAGILK